MIDTHAHMHHKRFNSDRDEIMEKLKTNVVTDIIEVSIGFDSNFIMREKMDGYEHVYYASAVHPSSIVLGDPQQHSWMEHLKRFAKMDNTVAIGEFGLDHHIEGTEANWPLQEEWCHKFIELAESVNKPMIFHFRDAHEDAIRILREHVNSGEMLKGVVHCFHGTPEQARDYLELGLYLGIGGMLIKEPQMEETIQVIPLERIVLETDAPYVTPPPLEGKNSPLNIPLIAEHLAQMKGVTVEEVDQITTQNAKQLFQLNK